MRVNISHVDLEWVGHSVDRLETEESQSKDASPGSSRQWVMCESEEQGYNGVS